MSIKFLTSNTSELTVEAYYEPMIGEFNLYPCEDSSMNYVDTGEILKEYIQRFEDAWRELAEK